MKNTIKFFGFIALVAIIGFSMLGCGGEEEKNPNNDPNELTVQVVDNTFGNTDKLQGTVRVAFMSGDGLSEANLNWLTAESFSLSFNPSSGRTASITSISKSQYNSGRVDVTLNLTRSALPNFGGGILPTDSVTATVSVTAGGGYTVKMNDQKYFTF